MHVALASAYDPFPDDAHPDDEQHLGGVENVLRHFADGLNRRGHQVTVVCSGKGGDSERDGVTVRRVSPIANVMRAPVVDLRGRIPDCDVVHVAASYPFVTSRVLKDASRRDMAGVLDFHFEPDLLTPVGRLVTQVYRRLGPRAYPLADRVLVRSHDYGRNAPSLRGVPEASWTAIPNGVDTSRFTPGGTRCGDGNLLFVGRLVPYKGLETLVRALSRLDDAPPLWIAGTGPLEGRLRSVAKNLDVDVSFLGRVPDEELPRLYRGARLTVLPSVGRQECFGIVLLESMACGTPVISSDIPGVRAVAAMGGRTARSGDEAAWARALQQAIDDPPPGGHVLARRIHKTCGWPAIVAQLEQVYLEVTCASSP